MLPIPAGWTHVPDAPRFGSDAASLCSPDKSSCKLNETLACVSASIRETGLKKPEGHNQVLKRHCAQIRQFLLESLEDQVTQDVAKVDQVAKVVQVNQPDQEDVDKDSNQDQTMDDCMHTDPQTIENHIQEDHIQEGLGLRQEAQQYLASTANTTDGENLGQPYSTSLSCQQSSYSHGAVDALVESISEAMSMAKGYAKNIRMAELHLDTVLSALPYRSMMKSNFGQDEVLFGKDASSTMAKALTDIPTISRAFEEKYMRQALHGERSCSQGQQCECRFIDNMKPFTAVEFLTLKELVDPPDIPQLCVICSRKQTQFLYYDMVFNRTVYNGVIQRYGNMSGDNEYASECLLKCTRNSDISCMPKPIMSHQRNRYTVHLDHNQDIFFLKQIRVSPSDCVSSTSFAMAATAGSSHGGNGSKVPGSIHVNESCKQMASSSLSSMYTAGPGTATLSSSLDSTVGVPRPGKNRGF